MAEEPKKAEPTPRFVVGEVVASTAPAIVDTKDNNAAYTEIQMLCKIANDIDHIKKVMG